MPEESSLIGLKVDSAECQRKLDDLLARLADLGPSDMPDEFAEWQRDDMNRRRPTSEEVGSNTVQTIVFGRSNRLSIYRPLKKLKKPRQVVRRSFGPRPILRWELYEKLFERMRTLLQETMRWR